MRRNMVSCILTLLLFGCAVKGPTLFQAYDTLDLSPREKIAILKVDPKAHLKIRGVDARSTARSVKYVLLQPGRHEIWFDLSGQTLIETYSMTNKKYIDVLAGHTYILKSKGGGIFQVGDQWFPEIEDVTNDPNLHIKEIPKEDIK